MKMIAKHLKLRIPSFQFQCYRSKDISTLPVSSSPPPPSKPHHSSLRRHVSSAFKTVSCGCGCHSKSNNSDEDLNRSPPRFNVAMALPPSPEKKKKKKKKKRRLKKKKPSLRRRTSTSSAESGLFSSESFDEIDNEQDEEEEETETLVSSSKSISTDDSSSEFNPHLETIREKPYKKKKKKKISTYKKRKMKIKKSPSPENQSPARLSVFQRLIPCTVDGKVRESFAVVKKSEDPFEDFKRSMMEMIMEKQMFDEKDLEQLLHCLLSLNEKEHHGVIVEAFSEIWQSLFSRRSISRRSF